MSQSIATVVAALIAAFGGSVLGSVVALSRFKRERAFDRQLDWYERALRAAHEFTLRLEIAMTFTRESKSDASLLARVWQEVQAAHLEIDRCATQADLYGSKNAIQLARKLATVVQDAANETDAFDVPGRDAEGERRLELLDTVPERLRRTAKPLAEAGRRHLGLIS